MVIQKASSRSVPIGVRLAFEECQRSIWPCLYFREVDPDGVFEAFRARDGDSTRDRSVNH